MERWAWESSADSKRRLIPTLTVDKEAVAVPQVLVSGAGAGAELQLGQLVGLGLLSNEGAQLWSSDLPTFLSGSQDLLRVLLGKVEEDLGTDPIWPLDLACLCILVFKPSRSRGTLQNDVTSELLTGQLVTVRLQVVIQSLQEPTLVFGVATGV